MAEYLSKEDMHKLIKLANESLTRQIRQKNKGKKLKTEPEFWRKVIQFYRSFL